jgi:integrase
MAHVIRKPRSPFYHAVFQGPDGKPMWRTTKLADKKAALLLAREWEYAALRARRGALTAEIARKVVSDILERVGGERIDSRSVRDYFAEWMESRRAEAEAKGGNAARAGRSTLSRYQTILNNFLESLGKARAAASIGLITAADIERCRNRYIWEGKSHTTADFALTIIRGVFNTARRRGIIASNPAEAVDPLRGAAAKREAFSDSDVRRLLAAVDAEWQGMILFAVHAGLRLQDAANLTWGNIDRERRCLSFEARKTSHRKRDGMRETIVALHPDVMQWLRSRPEGRRADAPLFPSLRGRPTGGCRGLSLVFAALMDAAGIDCGKAREAMPARDGKPSRGHAVRKLGFHSLRHAMVSRLARAEVSADVRREMVGHGSDEIHRRYVHLDIEDQRAAVGKLPSLLPAP